MRHIPMTGIIARSYGQDGTVVMSADGEIIAGVNHAGLSRRALRRSAARQAARAAKKETARLGNQTSRAESKATSDHAASNLTQRETQHHEITR